MNSRKIKDITIAVVISLWAAFVIFLVVSAYFPESERSAVNWGVENHPPEPRNNR